MSSDPKVSVITAVLNRNDFIQCAVESVLAQTYPDIEYIVKDGGSTDGTLDVLARYTGKLNLISTKDDGIYDALNQGIRNATGEIIACLHSDDFYVTPNAIAHMVKAMTAGGADSAWGDLLYVDRNDINRVIRRWKSSPYTPGKFIRGWHPPHPTFFVRKSIYELYGAFRTDLRIASDYELMLRFLEKNRITSCYVPETIVTMRIGGASNRPSAILGTARRETARAWKLNHLRGGVVASILKPISKIPQLL
jgi:glycosyltransferase involved in cell wall biosynthesis